MTDELTPAAQAAADRKQRGRDWLAYLKAQIAGEAEPVDLTPADIELRRRTT